jgi:hypothetical protein
MRKHVLAALLLALVACGGDKITGTQSVTGSYSLRTVNGGSLPGVVYQDVFERDELTAGTINLSTDKTWSGTLGVRVTDLSDGTVVLDRAQFVSGTYEIDGSSITIDDPSHFLTFSGTASSGKLEIGADLVGLGMVTSLVYQK